ncbi:uncharacterized protein LOC121785097 isoform X2 [Salvia splendens]|uniref:uncharacterized protein LOC121785097 isoform X2 n=1 Tax=Salvia splendens TaxID=180675 RepID=UPI001C26A14C|nr:uncharacterized protein LOC121785097 isoform X2 [Salvia splendens]
MGGGAMRAAAKMAGITAASGGMLSITAEHYSATRKSASARPLAPASEEMKLVANNSEARPCLELDDWVFPDAQEAGGHRMPRVVFSGAPTLNEAEEATSELSAALEKIYLSTPNSVGNDDSETKACITSQHAVAPSVPAPAIMAFKFLHENSMAKNVVASIACDQNVWKAVLQNEDLQQFLQSHTLYWTEPVADYDVVDQNSSMGSDANYDAKSSTGSSEHSEYEFAGGFMDIIEKVKSSVTDMVSNLSGYLQNLFGVKGGADGATRINADAVMQTSFMGLAVMAILVILLKRTERA